MNVNDAHRCKMNGCTGETAGIAWIPDGVFITGNVHKIKIQQIQKKKKKKKKDFHFLVPECFIQNLVQIGTVVSENLYVHDLGQRSRNDLNLQYSHIFIHSIRCLLLLPFRSLVAIVSEKSTVFTFFP